MAAMVVGDLLLIFKLDSRRGEWTEEISTRLESGVRYMGLAFLNSNTEVAISGTGGEVRNSLILGVLDVV